MIKNKLIALATVAVLAGAAAPALAATGNSSHGNSDEGDSNWVQFGQQAVLASLQQKGVDATNVERWGPYLRAFVTQADGTTQQQFFQPRTLTPVDPT